MYKRVITKQSIFSIAISGRGECNLRECVMLCDKSILYNERTKKHTHNMFVLMIKKWTDSVNKQKKSSDCLNNIDTTHVLYSPAKRPLSVREINKVSH